MGEANVIYYNLLRDKSFDAGLTTKKQRRQETEVPEDEPPRGRTPGAGMAGDLDAGEFQGGARVMSGKLKVHVNQDKCQGHARCKSLAPDLFDLDEYGNAHEIGDGSVPAGLEDKAYLAQSNCPEIAIEVTEE